MSACQSSSPDDSIFARVDLFAGFGKQVWSQMEARSQSLAFPKGGTIVQAGDTSDEFFVLVSGRLEVSVNRSGRKVVLATLEPYSYFGEMAMLAAEPRSATVVATEDSVVIEMGRQLLMEIFRTHPELMDTMARNIAARKRANTSFLHDETALSDFAKGDAAAPAGLLDRLKQLLPFGR